MNTKVGSGRWIGEVVWSHEGLWAVQLPNLELRPLAPGSRPVVAEWTSWAGNAAENGAALIA